MAAPVFPLIGLERHRIGIDGAGVTTLAAAHGCPLRCRYCLNPQSWREDVSVKPVTPERLYDMVKTDDLYFQATGGGVVFGGGEPLLRTDFIRAFRALCGAKWRLTAETCLNVPGENLDVAMTCVDDFIVDIKDTNPDIYRRYTGAENARALANLETLLETVGPARVTVRVPRIPGYNTAEDVARSEKAVRAMGVEIVDVFDYVVREKT